MFNSLLLTTATLLLLTTPIHAVCGIHTFGHCEDKIIHWYDPLTGEICDPVDCGGGRAPPKTNVPGCGTIPLGPASYLSCWTPGFTGAPGPATVAHQSTTEEAAPVKTTAAQVQSTIVVTQSLVTPTKETTKETTAVAVSSSAEGGKEGSSAVVSTKASSTPETTAPAVLPSGQTGAQTGASNGTATSSSTSKPKTTDGTGAGAVVRGSVMAVVGAVVGVIVLV